MILEHVGLSQINGSLVVLDGVQNASYDEMVVMKLTDGTQRVGRIVMIEGDKCVIQVFEGTTGFSLDNTRTTLSGHPMMVDLSPEILGRTLDGLGRPIDGLGEIYPEFRRDVNGSPINPVSRVYPRNYIRTGISSIDALATLIRGQKLPIFSGSGMKHNELAVQIVKQADVSDGEDFAIVFAAMGVKNDVADYFKKSFEAANVMDRVVMLLNLANDPIVERIITPRAALTIAEYLAFDLGKNILVILTDMTSYCEALREFSSSKGAGIPGRKLNKSIGIMKAYSSCVGDGPFTTELAMTEEEKHLLREAGHEYGAATGRPRRVGPFDVVASRYGVQCQGCDELALTLFDVLDYMEEVPVVAQYKLADGTVTDRFPTGKTLDDAQPVVVKLPGWHCDITSVRKYEDLPEAARGYVEYLEKAVGCKIKYISVGPERDACIIRD